MKEELEICNSKIKNKKMNMAAKMVIVKSLGKDITQLGNRRLN